jgi:hypothetical protein
MTMTQVDLLEAFTPAEAEQIHRIAHSADMMVQMGELPDDGETILRYCKLGAWGDDRIGGAAFVAFVAMRIKQWEDEIDE